MEAVAVYLPGDIDLVHVARIDDRLSALSDRQLFIALHQLGFDGLVTNNYKMLDVPEEVATIIKTKAVVVAVEGLGHDPIRAVGAFLLELPGLAGRLRPGVSNVIRLRYQRRAPEDGWKHFRDVAVRRELEPAQLWELVKVTDEELTSPLLA